MKACKNCGAEKPRTEFYSHTRSKDRLQAYCKSCTQTVSRASRIKRHYGLTQVQWEAIRADQGNACAICRTPFTTTPQTDHCHTSGRVRGLTCVSCNLILGHAKDNPAILRSAMDYLARN